MSTRNKLLQISLALLYPIWGMFLLRFAGYKALLTLKDQSWGTRGADAPEPEIVHSEAVDNGEMAQVIALRKRDVA
jgi:hypothetical protein